jgi:acyl-coenzyme A thioesterase PaaI-like protein
MQIEDVPFNRLIGLQREPAAGEFSVSLPADARYHNHLGIVHAAAQLAVAEAASGEWMLRHFGARATEFIAVVRRMETKFKQAARGKILGKATVSEEARAKLVDELATKRACAFALRVDVFDEGGAHTLTGTVEWFITRRPAEDERAGGSGVVSAFDR